MLVAPTGPLTRRLTRQQAGWSHYIIFRPLPEDGGAGLAMLDRPYFYGGPMAAYFTALSHGRTAAQAWDQLRHDIQYGLTHGTRHDPHGPAILARHGDRREFAHPAGVYIPRNRGTACFIRWALDGVDLDPDSDDDQTCSADVALAALVRGQPRLLATALAIAQQIQSPDSPTGYIELPEPGPGEDPDQPRFAEATRWHEVLGYSGQRFFWFFGWVHGDGGPTADRSVWL
ncbi:MAG: hypothetical protein KKA73_18420 [Chloroflexi bacterium]|nr:hypothetical protein [Chloroflexota bacterium]MBU1749663.1 hypothetical protein [Chloroflexota bacterium]